jgi:hypothetical protein
MSGWRRRRGGGGVDFRDGRGDGRREVVIKSIDVRI